jgi:hypothetical protein
VPGCYVKQLKATDSSKAQSPFTPVPPRALYYPFVYVPSEYNELSSEVLNGHDAATFAGDVLTQMLTNNIKDLVISPRVPLLRPTGNPFSYGKCVLSCCQCDGILAATTAAHVTNSSTISTSAAFDSSSPTSAARIMLPVCAALSSSAMTH